MRLIWRDKEAALTIKIKSDMITEMEEKYEFSTNILKSWKT